VRSSDGHFVIASGLRWLSLMLLVEIPWLAVLGTTVPHRPGGGDLAATTAHRRNRLRRLHRNRSAQ
jgi:hypothetical protein